MITGILLLMFTLGLTIYAAKFIDSISGTFISGMIVGMCVLLGVASIFSS